MNINWTHAGPPVVAAFLASTVEFVEALTVILAVGSVRGWRSAVAGSGAAVIVLLLLIAVLGAALTHISLDVVRLVVGMLLLLFGLRWLRKAILRSARVIPLRDEAEIYSKQMAAMQQLGRSGGWNRIAFGATFQITMLEGIEVVFIVIAVGTGDPGLLLPAALGALAALLVVALLGFAVHRPLTRMPENALKFVVGVLLSAFGTFWLGEGTGVAWPGNDWSILALIGGFFIAALAAVHLCRKKTPIANRGF